jgi:hypothetical protein
MTEQPKHIVYIDLVPRSTYEPLEVHEEATDYGLGVYATSEQVVRWQAAQRAYDAAQAEMRALYEEAEQMVTLAEEIKEDQEAAEREQERLEWEAKRAVEEAEAEVQYGPRQWVRLDLEKMTNPTARWPKWKVYKRTVHHADCKAYRRRLSEHTDPYDGAVRTPEATRWFAQGAQEGIPTQPCKQCAAKVEFADFLPKPKDEESTPKD